MRKDSNYLQGNQLQIEAEQFNLLPVAFPSSLRPSSLACALRLYLFEQFIGQNLIIILLMITF